MVLRVRITYFFALIALVSSLQAQQKKIVVCSTTQTADFARQIVGDDWQVICVLAAGQDPHRYETRIEDSALIKKADLCVQNGWHLEGGEWMEKLAANAGKELVTCVTGVQPLLIDESGQQVKDPHAWFDPANAAIYVRNIKDSVCRLDPENAHKFENRARLYLGQLNALNNWINSQVVQIPANQKVLVTHHDAFGYFCQAYKFKSESPAGWSTEEMGEISTERRQVVVKTIREFGVRSIFVETSLDNRLITEIAREAGVEVGGKLYSDAMGPVDSAGETYIGMMRENVLTIVDALK